MDKKNNSLFYVKVNTVETDQNELSLTLIMPALLNALGNTINNIERCCVIRVVLSLDFENIGPPCMDVRLSRHVARLVSFIELVKKRDKPETFSCQISLHFYSPKCTKI